MILNQPDEINAYRNSDYGWTVECHNDKGSFTLPCAAIDINLRGSIGSPLEIEIIMRGAAESNGE